MVALKDRRLYLPPQQFISVLLFYVHELIQEVTKHAIAPERLFNVSFCTGVAVSFLSVLAFEATSVFRTVGDSRQLTE